jgi:hypothetical protein
MKQFKDPPETRSDAQLETFTWWEDGQHHSIRREIPRAEVGPSHPFSSQKEECDQCGKFSYMHQDNRRAYWEQGGWIEETICDDCLRKDWSERAPPF